MTELKQARKHFIEVGHSHDQAWDKYLNFDWDEYAEKGEDWHIYWKEYDDSVKNYDRASDKLLKLEIKHLLTTKISITA